MKKVLNKVEKLFLIGIIGSILPILLFLVGWWTSLCFVEDRIVFLFGLLGLGVGFVIDIIIFKQIARAYMWNQALLAGIYLFYSVCVFGFFMGVPVFNLAIGALAGVFMGRRFYHLGIPREKLPKATANFGLFTARVMALFSFASAYLAVRDNEHTAHNLQGMFKLPFLPTDQMIMVLIVVGGTGLVLTQYWVSNRLAYWAYGK